MKSHANTMPNPYERTSDTRKNPQLKMATLSVYRSKFHLSTKQEIISKRSKLFKAINGDAFFPIESLARRVQDDFLGEANR